MNKKKINKLLIISNVFLKTDIVKFYKVKNYFKTQWFFEDT